MKVISSKMLYNNFIIKSLHQDGWVKNEKINTWRTPKESTPKWQPDVPSFPID